MGADPNAAVDHYDPGFRQFDRLQLLADPLGPGGLAAHKHRHIGAKLKRELTPYLETEPAGERLAAWLAEVPRERGVGGATVARCSDVRYRSSDGLSDVGRREMHAGMRRIAAARPAGPPPTMSTSNSMLSRSGSAPVSLMVQTTLFPPLLR